jgi:3-dehydroquinate dehydratase I
MTARRRSAKRLRPRVVGVIASRSDLDRAIRMRTPPDLFEVRLDCLVRIVGRLERQLQSLRAPLIITARHSQEGGTNELSLRQRRDLLTRFLNCADYIDVELRSASALRLVLRMAEQKNVRRIISFHDVNSTPLPRILAAKARAAKVYRANIFKVATRTDTPIQLARLLDFITNKAADLPVSVMGIGQLGAISRVLLARAGSVLIYASVSGESHIEGQLSLEKFRALGIASRH